MARVTCLIVSCLCEAAAIVGHKAICRCELSKRKPAREPATGISGVRVDGPNDNCGPDTTGRSPVRVLLEAAPSPPWHTTRTVTSYRFGTRNCAGLERALSGVTGHAPQEIFSAMPIDGGR